MAKKCSRCTETKLIFRKHSTVCRECMNADKKARRQTKEGVVVSIYDGQKGSSKKRNHRPPEYTLEELSEWLYSQKLFHELYSEWTNSGHKRRLKPSVDRKHDDIHYCMSNIQLMTWGENESKAHLDHREGRLIYDQQPVQQLQLDGTVIEDFISQSEASRVTGIPQANIWKVLEGQRHSAGGFKWRS